MTPYSAQHKWVTGHCSTGKRGFHDRSDAKKVAKFMAKTGKSGTRPYHCPECEHWHLGNVPSPVRRGEGWDVR